MPGVTHRCWYGLHPNSPVHFSRDQTTAPEYPARSKSVLVMRNTARNSGFLTFSRHPGDQAFQLVIGQTTSATRYCNVKIEAVADSPRRSQALRRGIDCAPRRYGVRATGARLVKDQ